MLSSFSKYEILGGEMTIFDALWMHAEVNKKKRCARRWRVTEEIDRLMSFFFVIIGRIDI